MDEYARSVWLREYHKTERWSVRQGERGGVRFGSLRSWMFRAPILSAQSSPWAENARAQICGSNLSNVLNGVSRRERRSSGEIARSNNVILSVTQISL